MKITKAHIYGFGKHENVEIDFREDITAIFGNNEAGKSTVMSFIKAILFGFPNRSNKENKYEPRRSTTYGGRLYITLDSGKELSVERVYKKLAHGDVRVFFDDGSIGNEDDLSFILQGMKASIFQGVFHFGMHDLQQLEGSNGEDFTDYLLSASIIGNDNIFKLERMLQKEVEELYKPQGKKPLINQKIKEWKECDKSLNDITDLASSQLKLSQEVVEKEKKLQDLTASYEELKKELEEVNQEKELFPLYEQYMNATDQITLFQHASHLKHGSLQKWELLTQQEQQLVIEINALVSKMETLEENIKNLSFNEKLLSQTDKINDLYKQYTRHMNESEFIFEMKSTIKEEEKVILSKKLELEKMLDIHQLQNSPLTFHDKRKIEELDDKFQKLLSKKDVLTSQEESIRERISHLQHLQDETLRSIEGYTEIRNKQKIIEEYNKQQGDQVEHSLRKQLHKQKIQKVKQGIFSVYALSIILLVVTIFLFLGKQVAMAGITGFITILIVAFGFFYIRTLKRAAYGKDIADSHFFNHEQEITIQAFEQAKKYTIEYELLQKQVSEHMLQLKNSEWESDRIIDKFEEWEYEYFKVIEERETVFPYCIDQSLYTSYSLIECVKEVEEYQKKLSLFEQRSKESILFDEREHSLLNQIQMILQSVENDELPTIKHIEQFYKQLSTEKEKEIAFNLVQKQRQEVLEEKNTKQIQLDECRHQKMILLDESLVQTEVELYQLTSDWEEWRKATEQRNLIEQKFSHYGTLFQQMNSEGIFNLKNKWKKKEEQFAQIHSEHEVLREQIAHFTGRVSELTALLSSEHLEGQLEKIKGELKNAFSSYMISKIALHNIQSVIEEYKQYLLPTMLNTIESYFILFTGGKYKAVYIQNDQMIVESIEDERFSPNEVSQATKEQLYLAVRFALAVHLPFTERYPIIMDDPFVNFDQERLGYVSKALKELSNTHQIIYFTCHKSTVAQFFDEEKLVQLA